MAANRSSSISSNLRDPEDERLRSEGDPDSKAGRV